LCDERAIQRRNEKKEKKKEQRDPMAFKAKPLFKNPTPPRNLMEE